MKFRNFFSKNYFFSLSFDENSVMNLKPFYLNKEKSDRLSSTIDGNREMDRFYTLVDMFSKIK